MTFVKFIVGGFLVLLPVVIVGLFVAELISEFPKVGVFFAIALGLAVMITVGTELLISATDKRRGL